ncbi:unnamed protein product, partial [Gulo gulo]
FPVPCRDLTRTSPRRRTRCVLSQAVPFLDCSKNILPCVQPSPPPCDSHSLIPALPEGKCQKNILEREDREDPSMLSDRHGIK